MRTARFLSALLCLSALVGLPVALAAQCYACNAQTVNCDPGSGYDTCDEHHGSGGDSCKVSGSPCVTLAPSYGSALDRGRLAGEYLFRSGEAAELTVRGPLPLRSRESSSGVSLPAGAVRVRPCGVQRFALSSLE